MCSPDTENVESQSASKSLQTVDLRILSPNYRDGDECDLVTGMFVAFQ
jgi:hypothetical protein